MEALALPSHPPHQREINVEENNIEEFLENEVPPPPLSPHTPIESNGQHEEERDIEELRKEEVGALEIEEFRNNSS